MRDTFTSSRVGLLTWAFTAVIMGTVGLASYQFGTQSPNPSQTTATVRLLPSGLSLPPAGDVETTASITRSSPIGIMQLRNGEATDEPSGIEQSQIDVLQREIAGLRRRLSVLSEQNRSYSRRISDLEKQVALKSVPGKSAETEKMATGKAEKMETEPLPGAVTEGSSPAPATQMAVPLVESEPPPATGPTAAKRNTAPERPEKEPTDKTIEVNASPKPTPRKITLARAPEYATPGSDPKQIPGLNTKEPVRIVVLPEPAEEPVATGSIPNQAGDVAAGPFNAIPTRTVPEPTIIMPSNPVGRLRSGDESQIKRSDFGAVIGHYKSTAGAAKAWADFKEQNEERMRDLRPLLLERTVPEGGISLLVGPFGNAADAAIACAHLLDVTELCHPALYSGDPLVTAAEFRDNAF